MQEICLSIFSVKKYCKYFLVHLKVNSFFFFFKKSSINDSSNIVEAILKE